MSARTRLDTLTGLRFLAAAAVAVAHLPYLHFDTSLPLLLRRVMAEGAVGVPFFFVLSGFVLAYAYHDRLATPSRQELGKYYLARVGRVWPVHVLTLILAMVLTVGPPTTLHEVKITLANGMLVHAWVADLDLVQSYNSVSWTLSIEAFFYLLMPVLLWVMLRWRSAGPISLTGAAIGLWLVQLIWVGFHRANIGEWTLYLTNICPLVRVGEFTIGMLLGIAFLRSRTEEVPSSRAQTHLWTLAELMAVGLLLVLMVRSNQVSLVYRFVVYYTPAVALLVAIFARQRGWLSHLLATRIPVYLGEISFAFFMVHAIVFVHVGDAYAASWGHGVRAIVSVVAALIVAVVVHRLYEAPLRTRLPSWLGIMGQTGGRLAAHVVSLIPTRAGLARFFAKTPRA